MYIVDTFSSKGKNYAVCTGPDINRSMSAKRIKVSDKTYAVNNICFFEGFIGTLQVGFELDGPLPIPKGEVVFTN